MEFTNLRNYIKCELKVCCIVNSTDSHDAAFYMPWGRIGISLEPVSSKSYKLAFAPIKESDQTAYTSNLIKVFNLRFLGGQGFNVSSSGILKLQPDWVDISLCIRWTLACKVSESSHAYMLTFTLCGIPNCL